MAQLRKGAGLLQRQVGAHFDIDKAAVSSWEKGTTSPDKAKLVALDELYDAEGEVLTLYGVTPSVDVDALRRRVDELERQLRAVSLALVRTLRGVVAEGIVEQAELDELQRSLDEAPQPDGLAQ